MKITRIEKDPTLQSGNRLRAKADIAKRVRSTREYVLNIIDSMQVKEVAINKATYLYEINPQRLGTLYDELLSVFYQALDLNGSSSNWFLNEYLGKAFTQGKNQALQRLQLLAEPVDPTLAQAIEVEGLVSNPQYTQRYEIIAARAFENMKGFAGQASKDLGFILGQGVALGESPRIISRNIRKKFKEIEGYRSLRIARTEVNNAYTQARNTVNQDARDRLGLDVRVMHISALVDSTRPSHAIRHGQIYTPVEQNEWWSTGTNKINCLCSTVEILYINGEPTNKALIKKQRLRGEAYFVSKGMLPKGYKQKDIT